MATDVMKLGLVLSATNRMGPGINSAIGMLGKVAGAIGLVGLAYKGFDAITKYDDAIQSLSAVTGVSGAALNDMKKEIISLAKESRKSAYEIAKSFENVGSNMSEYLTDPKGLRQIASAGVVLSKASRMELAPALDNLTTIMNQFDLKAKNAAKSVDILTAGEKVGNVRTAQISSSLQEFGASASNANVNLGESVAMIEVLGKKLKTDQIGVAGRNILLAMSAAKALPREAIRYLDAYGVSTKKLMNPSSSLIDRLTELNKISGDNAAMVKVFGKENITAATILLKSLPLYKDWENQIQTTNESNKQADTNTRSFINRMNELKASFDNVLIAENENTGALGLWSGVIKVAADNMGLLVQTTLAGIAVFSAIKIYAIASTAAIWAYTLATDLASISQNGLMLATLKGTAALKLATAWIWLTSAATWSWAAALWATGIPEIVIGVIALGAGLYYLVKYWDEVTAAIKRFASWLYDGVISKIIWLLKAFGELTHTKWAIDMAFNMQSHKNKFDAADPIKAVASSQGIMLKGMAAANNSNSTWNYSPNITFGTGSAQEKQEASTWTERDFKQKMDLYNNRQKRLSYSRD